jgi:hypothetical protein
MMTKYLLPLFVAMTLLFSDGVAQTDSFDVYQYQAPEFFTKSELPSRVQFSMKNNDTSFCIITIYQSGPAKDDVMKDVIAQWNEQVLKRLNKADKKPARIFTQQLWDGWASTMALGNFYQQKKKSIVMLNSFQSKRTTACVVYAFSDTIFKPVIEKFSKNLHLNNQP